MAIKVNGTTVIDDSRNFTNIAGGFKTVNGTSVVGSGDISAGASTTAGAVGTYLWGRPANNTDYTFGDTATGLYPTNTSASWQYNSYWSGVVGSVQSGTWRSMGRSWRVDANDARVNLWVRIS